MPTRSMPLGFVRGALLIFAVACLSRGAEPAPAVDVKESDDAVQIETDMLRATVVKKGYVSGVKAGTLIDKKTGAHELGFGLHIMDFLLGPGWRDDGYPREPAFHGDLPKHYVEGPQICTQAKELPVTVERGDGFVALRMHYTYNQPGKGYKAGSTWEQTLVFQPGKRYFFSSEKITSANDVDELFYREDMPGHIRHTKDDNFIQVYLSYLPDLIPASAFNENFAPDARFLYQRHDDRVPERMIRAYQVKLDGKPGPWLAGMTLDPADVAEAWCHQRGYVCFIEELHRRQVRAGETFGAAYVIGWFDDIPEMQRVYDQHKGAKTIVTDRGKFQLK